MSVSSILLFVGATTLIAALLTLCAFQMNVAKLERRINRRSRTLEGPVPGHRSLSSVGLNAEAAKGSGRSGVPQGVLSTSPAAGRKETAEKVSSLESPVKESRLNSLQTIQARSAALQGDDQWAKPADSGPSMPARSQSAQRGFRRDGIEQEPEQGLAASPPKGSAERLGGAGGSMPSSAAAGVEPAVQTAAPRAPASKRAKRSGVQAGRTESPRPSSDRRLPSTPADAAGLEYAGGLPSGGNAGAVGSAGDSLPDIFGILNEAESGMQGLADDLGDIDGGGLPGAAQKIPQKARR